MVLGGGVGEAIIAIGGGIAGAVTFLNSMPSWFKYFIFMGFVWGSTLIEGFTGIGIISGVIEFVVDKFGIQGFQMYDWQILILASTAFFVIYLFRTQT